MNDSQYIPKPPPQQARANYREVTEKLGALGLNTAIPGERAGHCRDDRGPDPRGL